MSIVWLRHGETALNAARVLQPADTPLSPRGQAQAEAVARRLVALAPAALLASDLPRAWQTAQALAHLTGLPVQAEPLLRERHFGDWRGQPYDALGVDPATLADAPPGGESMVAFLARAAQAWDAVRARRAALGGPLVVVSHGLLIHAVLHRLAGAGVTVGPLANTAVSIVAAEPPHALQLAGCTAHLDAGSPAGDPRTMPAC